MPCFSSQKMYKVELREREEWAPIPVPALVAEEVDQRVQEKLAYNQQRAARNTAIRSRSICCGAT